MRTPNASPALATSRGPKAPEPSAALLALQEKGLELPPHRIPSISPSSNPTTDPGLRVSPLSMVSTPSNLDKPPPLEPGDGWSQRPSSANSAETTVTGILNLYTNLSEHSLKSEYEEISPCSEDSDDEEPLQRMVHQPKAYRDTIAPLLEYQFSSEKLTIPPVPSPMSVASLPHLHHPNAAASIPSLYLASETLPDKGNKKVNPAGLSQTSIQITPEMTPPLPLAEISAAPSFQQYSACLRERKIALEVPDVRDAESWYDQPLSPISSKEVEIRIRDSKLSAVSPDKAVSYQRQLTYDALVPPASTPKKSPNMKPVDLVRDEYLPEPLAATLIEVVDNKMVPPPLELGRSTSNSRISEGSAPVHTPEINQELGENMPKSQLASPIAHDSIEGPTRGYLKTPPPERCSDMSATKKEKPNIDEIYRPGSAFSTDSSQRSPDGIGGHLKAVFRLGKKKKEKRKDSKDLADQQKKEPSRPVLSTKRAGELESNDDLESYKYSYWKSHASAPHPKRTPSSDVPSQHRFGSPGVASLRSTNAHDTVRGSMDSGPGPSVVSSPQPLSSQGIDPGTIGKASPRSPLRGRVPQPAHPLTDYQKYGAEIWDEKKKMQRLKREEKDAKAAEKEGKKQAKAAAKIGVISDQAFNSFLDKSLVEENGMPQQNQQIHNYFHSRPASSKAYSQVHSNNGGTSASQPSSETASIGWRKSGRYSRYSNDLFEASGGKKKGGYMSRLMMSSEERRKQKVKDSITIIGGGKLNMQMHRPKAGRGNSDSGTCRGLVKI